MKLNEEGFPEYCYKCMHFNTFLSNEKSCCSNARKVGSTGRRNMCSITNNTIAVCKLVGARRLFEGFYNT